MYVTRPLSLYKNKDNHDAINEAPPHGPASGYLVVQDKEYEDEATCCFGMCRNVFFGDLPFPQDRRLTVKYTTQNNGQSQITYLDQVYFIPVVDLPLSSNRYYVIIGKRNHKGMVSTCSTEDDKVTCCFCQCVKDVNPREFDPTNVYQQVEVFPYTCCGNGGTFTAKSLAPDGFPQTFLRRKGWTIYGSTKHVYPIKLDALGINAELRARKPDTSFSGISSPPFAIGKWYCPFLFVKEEDMSTKNQVKDNNLFYEMSLEQLWQETHECEYLNGGMVKIYAGILTERPLLHLQGGGEIKNVWSIDVEGVKWFKQKGTNGGGVGLDMAIMNRMRWEQERAGWTLTNEERVEKLQMLDEKDNKWMKFKCYILVERFSLRRLDGTLLLTYDFKHLSTIMAKSE